MPGGEFLLLYWVAHHCWWGGQGVGLGILVLTGGKGSLTWQVHCEFIVGSETIHPHFTQWVHAGFFSKVPSNLPPKNPPGKG